jgi:hypothetical protein
MTGQSHGDVPFEAADERLHELLEEFLQRTAAGDTVSPDQFAAEHPEHELPLKQFLPAVLVLSDLNRSVSVSSDNCAQAAERLPRALGDFRILREVWPRRHGNCL